MRVNNRIKAIAISNLTSVILAESNRSETDRNDIEKRYRATSVGQCLLFWCSVARLESRRLYRE